MHRVKTLLAGIFILFLASCAYDPARFYFGAYSEGEAFFNEGKYEEALEKFQAYLDEEPAGNMAIITNYYMGRSHMALNQNQEARLFFEKVIEAGPDQIWADFARTQLEELSS